MTGKPNITEVLRQYRWASRQTVRQLAAQIDIDDGALSRFERGESISAETLTKVLRWLLNEAQAEPQPGLPIEGEGQ